MSFVSGANYAALPRNAHKWLIETLLPSAGSFTFSGQPKTGKSWCLLDMIETIANPQRNTWNGFPVTQHGNVMILQLDTPRVEWADRVERLTDMGRDFSNVYFADIQSVPFFPFDILDPKSVAWLKQEVATINPVLVVIDTLRDMHSGDENDATTMRNVLLTTLATLLPATCGLIAHEKKTSQYMAQGGDDLINDVRGSGAVVGKMDNIIHLTKNRLSWRGRAGEGHVNVKQDKTTGLFALDGDAAKEELAVKVVVQREQNRHPSITVKDCAKAVCEEIGGDWLKISKSSGEYAKLRTAERRVKEYYVPAGG